MKKMDVAEVMKDARLESILKALDLIYDTFNMNQVSKSVGISAMMTFLVNEMFEDKRDLTKDEKVEIIKEWFLRCEIVDNKR